MVLNHLSFLMKMWVNILENLTNWAFYSMQIKDIQLCFFKQNLLKLFYELFKLEVPTDNVFTGLPIQQIVYFRWLTLFCS